jgi:hypothetical protein
MAIHLVHPGFARMTGGPMYVDGPPSMSYGLIDM